MGLTIVIASGAAAPVAEATSVVLVDGGETDYTIVVGKDAVEPEKHAAAELQKFLREIGGVKLQIASDRVPVAGRKICVGPSAAASKIAHDLDVKSLGLEGYHLKTVAGDLIIAGGRPRGVLYGVYSLLEDELGCRWFTPDCSRVPESSRVAIGALDRRFVPPLEYRATDYPNSRDPDWAVRNKMNGTLTHLDAKRGGKIAYAYFVHTFNSILNPKDHFDKHPEWFSMVGGRRVGGRTQLCLTNPEVLEITKKRVRSWIKAHPLATIFSVSQNDWHNYCQCPQCRALAEREGSQAGPIIAFVNAIAEDIEKDFPDKIISTLAYQYSRKPPKTLRPRHNVTVRLCSIECCFIHPLETDPYNKTFVRDIRGWSKICKRLSIWDYVINYAHSIMPFPNLYVLKPNISFFVRNGVTSVYEEANYYSKGGELAELRTYVMAKTLWDPSYDTDKAIDEFCEGYYGAAGPLVRQYVKLIHDEVRDAKYHVRIYSAPSMPYMNDGVMAQAAALFDRAEAAVKDDPKLLHRVQVARLPVMYVQIARAGGAYELILDAIPQAHKLLGKPKPTPVKDALVNQSMVGTARLLDRFEGIARSESVSHIREGRTFDDWIGEMRRRQRGTIPVVRLSNGAVEVVVVPEVGGKIWQITDLKRKRGVLMVPKPKAGDVLVNRDCNYEEYSQIGWRSPGYRESYKVTARDARSVEMTADLKNGLRISRGVSLAPEGTTVRVRSTVGNPGDKPVDACLRVHPCFALGKIDDAVVWFRRGDAGWERRPLKLTEDPQAEKEQFYGGKALPAGAWLLTDAASDYGVLNRFDPRQVDQVLLNWSGEHQRVNLELFSPSRTLRPGEAMTIDHSYELIDKASALTAGKL